MLFDGEIIVSWKKWDRVKFYLETSRAFIGKFLYPYGKNSKNLFCARDCPQYWENSSEKHRLKSAPRNLCSSIEA